MPDAWALAAHVARAVYSAHDVYYSMHMHGIAFICTCILNHDRHAIHAHDGVAVRTMTTTATGTLQMPYSAAFAFFLAKDFLLRFVSAFVLATVAWSLMTFVRASSAFCR